MTTKKEELTPSEKSILAYIECCCVDRGGLLEGVRMNSDDHDCIKRLVQLGILRSGRIPFSLIKGSDTYWAELTGEGWPLCGEIRQWLARSEARGPHATKVFNELREREVIA